MAQKIERHDVPTICGYKPVTLPASVYCSKLELACRGVYPPQRPWCVPPQDGRMCPPNFWL